MFLHESGSDVNKLQFVPASALLEHDFLMVKICSLWCLKYLAMSCQEIWQAINKSTCLFSYWVPHNKETEEAQISYADKQSITLKDDMQLLYKINFAQ